MNIRADGLQITSAGPIHRHGFVAALEQMPKDPVPAVITLRVGSLQPFHPGHEVGFRRLDQKVIVISHQHIGVNAPAGFVAGLAQSLQKALPVPVIVEDGAALVAAGHDVVRCPGKLDAQWSGHDCAIPPQSPVQVKPQYQYPRTDPFIWAGKGAD